MISKKLINKTTSAHVVGMTTLTYRLSASTHAGPATPIGREAIEACQVPAVWSVGVLGGAASNVPCRHLITDRRSAQASNPCPQPSQLRSTIHNSTPASRPKISDRKNVMNSGVQQQQ